MKLIKLYEQVLTESFKTKFIAYHGTDYDISKFSDSFIDGEKVTQQHGSGIYFATNYENARMFGKNIYKVELIGNFISEDTPISETNTDDLISLMKLSDEDEWELEAQNYHPDPEVGLSIALEDALNQENEAAAFMRIQSGGWYIQNGIGYVRAMTKIGIDGMIVNPPKQWVNEKHIIIFNPKAIKFIKKMDDVNEDLNYKQINTNGPEDDKYEISEINIPNLRLPNHTKVSDEEKEMIRNLKYSDLKIRQSSFDGNIANMIIKVPWDSVINDNGIIVDIQVIKNELYQIHIDLNKYIRGLGLGYKLYVALIHDLGHIYSSKGRRQNVTVINKILKQLSGENDFESYSNNLGDLIILKNNPNKEKLLKLTNNL